MANLNNAKVGLILNKDQQIDSVYLTDGGKELLKLNRVNDGLSYYCIVFNGTEAEILKMLRLHEFRSIPNRIMFRKITRELFVNHGISFGAVMWGEPKWVHEDGKKWFTLNQQKVISDQYDVSEHLVDFVYQRTRAEGDALRERLTAIAKRIFEHKGINALYHES